LISRLSSSPSEPCTCEAWANQPGGTRLANQPCGTAAPAHADDLSIIGERDRIATQLQDTVIRRIFAAGLILQSAAELITNPEVRWRIEAAVSELDEVFRGTRNVRKGRKSQTNITSPDLNTAVKK
jgi:hypothetical protein